MTAPDFAFRPQLAEDVARYVRKRIFDGTYAAGQYIRLDQLATELGVSVTPVREALFVLSAEGLLSQQPRRGFVVVSLTGRDLTDVANVQAHIGGELAARAAVNITDEQLRELEKVQTELEDAYASDDDDRAVRLNHEFHKAINVAADSPKLAQLMSQITRYAPESVFPTITGWPDQSTEHHRKLLAALEERDENLARTADVRAPRGRRVAVDRTPNATRRCRLTARAVAKGIGESTVSDSHPGVSCQKPYARRNFHHPRRGATRLQLLAQKRPQPRDVDLARRAARNALFRVDQNPHRRHFEGAQSLSRRSRSRHAANTGWTKSWSTSPEVVAASVIPSLHPVLGW